jgi:peroxiredoxin
MGVARSHFVIDEQGKVVDVQYNVRPEDSVSLSRGLKPRSIRPG